MGKVPLALAAVLLVVPGDPPADPFEAALAGPAGPGSVLRAEGDPELAAVSWGMAPRRAIVDGLAARLLRGDRTMGASGVIPRLPEPPRRGRPWDGPRPPAVDPLAPWVPADAAAVFFRSVGEAADAVRALTAALPRAFPGLCGDGGDGARDAVRRSLDRLLLPSIWGANPGARTGVRSVALVIGDPDLQGGPALAVVCEVEDASLLLAERKASFGWEDRTRARFRVDGLDAATDDGSVRSFFALKGGTAVFANSAGLRARVLAAGGSGAAGIAGTTAYVRARSAFPAPEGGPLLVVPDEFLARASSAETRLGRAAALRCEAARLLLDARTLAGAPAGDADPTCPAGGGLRRSPRGTGASCSVHGSAAHPVPLEDLPAPLAGNAEEAELGRLARAPDAILEGALPLAVRFGGGDLAVLVPGGVPGEALLRALALWTESPPGVASGLARARRRLGLLAPRLAPRETLAAAYEALTGLLPPAGYAGPGEASPPPRREPPPARPDGGVLRVRLPAGEAPVLEWL